MNIERYQTQQKRNNGCWSGMGCAGASLMAVLGIALALLILLPNAPGLLLQVAGFENAGRTDDVFQQTGSSTPVPTLSNARSAPPNITVRAGTLGERTIPASTGGYTAQTGGGQMQIRSDEISLLNLCREFTNICESGGDTVRNASFDLRPGGVVVNADLYVPQLNNWQRVGVVMTFSGRRVRVSGVDINGQLYTAPPGEIGSRISEIEAEANQLLAQIQVSAGGSRYALREIYADDQILTLLLD